MRPNHWYARVPRALAVMCNERNAEGTNSSIDEDVKDVRRCGLRGAAGGPGPAGRPEHD